MMLQMVFFARRMALGITLVSLQWFIFGQLAVQYAFSTGLMIAMLWLKPKELPFDNWLATFNEAVTILMLYAMMYFSDFLTDLVWRNNFGIAYIVTVCLYILTYLSLLGYDGSRILFVRAKYFYYWRKHIIRKKFGIACARLCCRKKEKAES